MEAQKLLTSKRRSRKRKKISIRSKKFSQAKMRVKNSIKKAREARKKLAVKKVFKREAKMAVKKRTVKCLAAMTINPQIKKRRRRRKRKQKRRKPLPQSRNDFLSKILTLI